MRGTALGLLLLVPPARIWAGQVPDPVFWASPAAFLKQVDGGELVRRLELHLLQYASDPRWRSEWAADRYTRSGLHLEYGSTTSNELYTSSRIALNAFPAEWLQIRYDRRQLEDNRFELSDQRLEALWYPGASWAVVLTGWPAFEKEYVSLGFGLRLGAPRSPSALDLRVIEERTFWNEKTDTGVRFTRQPLRLLADGFHEAGPWRIHGSIDCGLEYRAEETGPGGRQARGFQRLADLELEHTSGDRAVGARVTGSLLLRSESEAAGAVTRLDRRWGRAVVSYRESLGRWTASALAGAAWQRDDFSSPSGPSGSFALDTWLGGVDGSLQATTDLQLGIGYLGSLQRGRRTIPVPGPLLSADADGYLDKAHVRAVYAFGPRMSIEVLLSQALRGGRFGGGSVKAVLVP